MKQFAPIFEKNSFCGINPKSIHFDELLAQIGHFGFLEFHTENLFAKGHAYKKILSLRESYPFSFHSVGLSLGSFDGICQSHLEKTKREIEIFEPFMVSEHLSFSGFHQRFVPDLLPLPLNDQSLEIFVRNINTYQDAIKRQILVENPSQYIAFRNETYSLGEFLNTLCERTGCAILLDVNNLEVCENNIGTNGVQVISQIKKEYVKEIHLAGYKAQPQKNGKAIFLDNHGSQVSPKVWDLYTMAIKKFGDIPSLIEWDDEVPPLSVLFEEAQKANNIKSKLADHEFA